MHADRRTSCFAVVRLLFTIAALVLVVMALLLDLFGIELTFLQLRHFAWVGLIALGVQAVLQWFESRAIRQELQRKTDELHDLHRELNLQVGAQGDELPVVDRVGRIEEHLHLGQAEEGNSESAH